MNESMRYSGGPDSITADMSSAADYRIREVEARLDRRLAAVEAQRARTRWAARLLGVALVLALTALAVVVRDAAPREAWTVTSLSAEEIVLRDADGIARGQMGTDAEGRTQLSLSDRDGRERIRLTVLADGSPGVTISDSDARPRAVLGYLPDGTTNLVFADAQGVGRAIFGLDPDGSTQALFTDRAGAIRTVVGVGSDGTPTVSVFEGDAEAPGASR